MLDNSRLISSALKLLRTGLVLVSTLVLLPAAFTQTGSSSHLDAASPPGRVFSVSDFEAEGAKSKFDVAKDAALAWIMKANSPAVLQLGDEVYPTCTGVQMPTQPIKALSIIGQGKGESGMGTTIKAFCAMGAMVDFPSLPSSNWWSNLVIAHLTLDGNELAQSCMDLEALRISRIEDVSCTKAIGAHHWVQIGDPNQPKGVQSTGFQVMVDDLFIFNNATGVTSWAKATPVVESGSITSFSIASGGSYRQKDTAPVLLTGYGAGSQPCKVMPTGVLAHLAKDPASPYGLNHVVSVTQATAGSGCVEPIYAHIMDIPKAQYGLQLATTDSTLKDITVDSVGATAAIASMIGGANMFIHAHAWQSPVLFQTAGNDVWVGSECDLPLHYCFDFRGRRSSISNTVFYWSESNDPAFQGSSGYFAGESAVDTQISTEDCGSNLQNSGGYARFVGPHGPLEFGSMEFARKFSVIGGRDCHASAPLPAGLAVSSAEVASSESGVLINRELRNFTVANQNSGTGQTLLIAHLPRPASATGPEAAVAIRLLGGQIGTPRSLSEFTFANGFAGLMSNQTGWGSQEAAKHAGILAFAAADASIDLYLFVGPGRAVANLSVEMPSGPVTIYPNPEEKTPIGRQVFSSAASVAVPKP